MFIFTPYVVVGQLYVSVVYERMKRHVAWILFLIFPLVCCKLSNKIRSDILQDIQQEEYS